MKKILSMTLSLVLFVSMVVSTAVFANAASTFEASAADLGETLVASIYVPALDKAFTNISTNVVTEAVNGEAAQLWSFEKVDDTNAYRIVSELDGRFLAVDDIESGYCNVNISSVEQAFHLREVGDKYFIHPVGAGEKALDVNGVDFNVQYRGGFDPAENVCALVEIVVPGTDEESSDVVEESSDAAEESSDAAEESSDAAEESSDAAEESSDAAEGESSAVVEESSEATEESSEEAAPTEVNYAAGKKYTTVGSGKDGAPAYLGDRADDGKALTDGILVDDSVGFGQIEYVGGTAVHTITIDLGAKRTDIDKLVFAGCRIDGNRQFANVTIEVSNNGKSFTKVDSSAYVRTDNLVEAPINDVVMDFNDDVTARYVRLTCANTEYVFSVSEIQVIGYGATSGGTVNPGENENPGDAGFAIIALAAIVSLAGAVVVSKKKFN